jgi:hypothetical protein
MAIYKYVSYLKQMQSDAFDADNTPGTAAPYSGIYRCMGCGKEVASNQGQPLPPQNHHQHDQNRGSILWRLIVFADHEPK